MLLLLMLVFMSIFAVAALLLVASGTGASQRTKQTLAALESALATGRREVARSDRRHPQAGTAQRHSLDQSLGC